MSQLSLYGEMPPHMVYNKMTSLSIVSLHEGCGRCGCVMPVRGSPQDDLHTRATSLVTAHPQEARGSRRTVRGPTGDAERRCSAAGSTDDATRLSPFSLVVHSLPFEPVPKVILYNRQVKLELDKC